MINQMKLLTYNISLSHFFQIQSINMQVESGIPKWSGRVPPLDLTNVSVCPSETEKRWHKIQPISKKNYDNRIGTDGLPLGMCNFTN